MNNLVIHGLPPSYSEAAKSESVDPQAATPAGESARFETSTDSDAIFIGFCGELGIDIQSTNIEACHRLPRSAKSKHATLLVRFTNRRIRATVSRRPEEASWIQEGHIRERAPYEARKRDLCGDSASTKTESDQTILTSSGRVMVRLLDAKTREISSKGDLASLS